jgi:hypothetical protein
MHRVAITLFLVACLLVCLDGSNREHSTAPLVRVLRPSERDFVEVVRGGEMATELVLWLREDFAVPKDGYLVIKGFSGDDEEPIILCPNSVRSLEDCERDAESGFSGTFRLTFFGVELGPQTFCVQVHSWDSERLAETCQSIVGSEHFPGLQETLHYFQDHTEEFVGDAALHVIWSRLGAVQGEQGPFSIISIGSRSGNLLQSTYFLGRGGKTARGLGGSSAANVTAARAMLVCLGAECKGDEYGAVYEVSRDGGHRLLATIGAHIKLSCLYLCLRKISAIVCSPLILSPFRQSNPNPQPPHLEPNP